MSVNNKKVIVGMSGGVDSSVSLYLLKKQGYDVIGVSFRYAHWKNKANDLKENVCCSADSFSIARSICKKLGVPYHIIDEQADFKQKVMGYFLSVLKSKRTPNPCIYCNRFVKFNKLADLAKKHKASYIATGHYARVKKNMDGKFELLKAKDKVKDQSYFLCLLNQAQLAKTIFPIGNLTKDEVYRIAKKAGFNQFKKVRQSQDLCFVSANAIPAYINKEIGKQPGEIVDGEGKVIGRHQGLFYYTIGQRKGLDLSQGPWYVADMDLKNNRLVVVSDAKSPLLFKKTARLKNTHFISGRQPRAALTAMAKTRYHQVLAKAKVIRKNSQYHLEFTKPQKAVTPGQWAVFYNRNICLGGGFIDSVK